VCTWRRLCDPQIERLIKNFVDVNSADYDNRTALHLAASNGKLNVLEYLGKSKGIIWDPEDRVGGTPLQDAINHGHADVQKFLREAGATVRTPLLRTKNGSGVVLNAEVRYAPDGPGVADSVCAATL
jgi:ankyrin repeat protein